jgi:hypothetical protein
MLEEKKKFRSKKIPERGAPKLESPKLYGDEASGRQLARF